MISKKVVSQSSFDVPRRSTTTHLGYQGGWFCARYHPRRPTWLLPLCCMPALATTDISEGQTARDRWIENTTRNTRLEAGGGRQIGRDRDRRVGADSEGQTERAPDTRARHVALDGSPTTDPASPTLQRHRLNSADAVFHHIDHALMGSVGGASAGGLPSANLQGSAKRSYRVAARSGVSSTGFCV